MDNSFEINVFGDMRIFMSICISSSVFVILTKILHIQNTPSLDKWRRKLQRCIFWSMEHQLASVLVILFKSYTSWDFPNTEYYKPLTKAIWCFCYFTVTLFGAQSVTFVLQEHDPFSTISLRVCAHCLMYTICTVLSLQHVFPTESQGKRGSKNTVQIYRKKRSFRDIPDGNKKMWTFRQV